MFLLIYTVLPTSICAQAATKPAAAAFAATKPAAVSAIKPAAKKSATTATKRPSTKTIPVISKRSKHKDTLKVDCGPDEEMPPLPGMITQPLFPMAGSDEADAMLSDAASGGSDYLPGYAEI